MVLHCFFGPTLGGQFLDGPSCSHGSLPLCSVVKWATFSPFWARRYSVGHCEEEASRPPVHTLRSRSEFKPTDRFRRSWALSAKCRAPPSGAQGPCFLHAFFVAPAASLPRLRHIVNDCFLEEPLALRGWAFSLLPCGLGPELCAVGRCRRRAAVGTSRALARQGTHRRQKPERFAAAHLDTVMRVLMGVGLAVHTQHHAK